MEQLIAQCKGMHTCSVGASPDSDSMGKSESSSRLESRLGLWSYGLGLGLHLGGLGLKRYGLGLWSHGLGLGLHPGGLRLTVSPGESGEKMYKANLNFHVQKWTK